VRNKIDEILDAIYGQKVKGRWIKVLISIASLLFLVGGIVFLSTNLGYKNGKFFLKPWDVKIELDVKKTVSEQK